MTRILARKVTDARRGQALVEIVLLTPVLLLIGLGLIEVSRTIETMHIISGLTREGANIASRGASLTTTVNVTRSNQQESGLGTAGGVIASHIIVDDGVPYVESQVASPGYELMSRVGLKDSIAKPYVGAGLLDGGSYHVVELFYPFAPVTPLFGALIPGVLYDRSLF